MGEPTDESAAEERLYRLTEALQEAHERGEVYEDEVWAQRFDVDLDDARRARAALELLLEDPSGRTEPLELAPPALPEDYELLEELGRGGMGVVYRVRQRSLDRELALKVLRPGELAARRALERFRREAHSLARLRHPHIARLHEVGECAGRVYFTMDLIRGRSLAARIRDKELTPSQAVRWLRQVTSAIQYVHGHGLVHRDLKPANILIDESDDACVVDFGLARDLEVTSELTQSGHFLGTPAYMAPEQARGRRELIGERTDVYALGAVLYECLTGKPLFASGSIVELVRAVCDTEPVPPRKLDPKIPPDLELVCLKALAKDPEERYATARALLEDLERFEDGRRVRAEPPRLATRVRGFVRRRQAALNTVMFTALVVAAFFWFVVLPAQGPSGADRLAVADELLASEEASAAAALYEAATKGMDDEELDPRLAERFAAALLARGDSVTTVAPPEARRDWRRVVTLAEAALANLPEGRGYEYAPARARLLPLVIRAQSRLADREGLRSSLDRLGSVLGTSTGAWRAALAGEWSTGIPPVGAGDPAEGAVALARESLPALVDRQDPLRAAALFFWTEILSGAESFHVFKRLVEQDGPREELIAALLRSADEIPPLLRGSVVPALKGSPSGDWWEVVSRCHRGRFADRLSAGLRDLHAPDPAHPYVVFLSDYLDLPAGITDERLVLLLRECLVSSVVRRGNDLRQRVGFVVESVERDPRLMTPAVDRWLTEHTSTRPPTKVRELQAQYWLGWWRENRHLDPREWFLSALELPEIPERDALFGLLSEFDEATGLRRRWYHELFQASTPEELSPPLWPSCLDREPDGLADDWHALLDPDRDTPRWRVNLAGLSWREGEPEPELRWQRVREVREQELIRHEFEVPLAPGSAPTGALGLGHPSPPPEFRRPDSITAEVRGGLKWARGGILLEWEHPGMVLFDDPAGIVTGYPWANVTAPPHSTGCSAGRVACAATIETRRAGDYQPESYELVLSILSPLESPDVKLGLQDWRARIAADVAERRREVEEGAQEGPLTARALPGGPSLAHTLWLAGLLPSPDAAADLGFLFDFYQRNERPYYPPKGFDATALLAVGDAQPLEDPARFQRLLEQSDRYLPRKQYQIGALSDGYWEHLLLATAHGSIRDEAARRLVDGAPAGDRLADLARALEEKHVDVPDALASGVASAEQRLAGQRRQQAVLVWGGRLVLAVLVGLLGWMIRRILSAKTDERKRGALATILLVGAVAAIAFPLDLAGEWGRSALFALAAFGAWTLAVVLPGRARFFIPLCLTVAFSWQLGESFGWRAFETDREWPRTAPGMMLVAAICGLPLLTAEFQARFTKRRRIGVPVALASLGVLVYVLPIADRTFALGWLDALTGSGGWWASAVRAVLPSTVFGLFAWFLASFAEFRKRAR